MLYIFNFIPESLIQSANLFILTNCRNFRTDSVQSDRAPAKQGVRDERTLVHDESMMPNRPMLWTWLEKDVVARV